MTPEQGKKQPNQKRHQKPSKKAPVQELTAEQQAAALAAIKKAEEDAKAEARRIELFNASVPKMSRHQLNGTLRNLSKSSEGGTAMWATALLIVSENTKTKENPFGKLSCYLR